MTSGRIDALAPPRLDATGWLLLVCLSALWGASFLFAKIALAALDPLALVLARVSLAAATLHAVIAVLGRRPLWRVPRAWRVLLFGVTNNVIPFSLIFWAQQSLDVGIAAILNATTPIFAMAIAAALTADERITPAKVLGMAIAFGGVAAIVGFKSLAGVEGHVLPALALLGASAFYGISAVWARRLTDVAPIEIAVGQLTGSTIVLAVLVPILAPLPAAVPPAGTIAAVVALAVASTALAYLIFFRLIRTAGATSATLVTFLVPVTATLLGALFMGERLAPSSLVGMVMVLVGVGITQIAGLAGAGRR